MAMFRQEAQLPQTKQRVSYACLSGLANSSNSLNMAAFVQL